MTSSSGLLPYAASVAFTPYSRTEPSVFERGLQPSPNNNGQYTGEPCRDLSSCGVQIEPSAEFMHTVVLKTIGSPGAGQPASEWRPGNNTYIYTFASAAHGGIGCSADPASRASMRG